MSTGPGANASILATRLGNLAATARSLRRRRRRGTRRRCRGPGSWAFPGPAAQALSGMAVAAGHAGPPRRGRDAPPRGAGRLRGGRVGGGRRASPTPASASWPRTEATPRRPLELHRRSLAKAALGSERRAMALAVEGLAGAHAVSADDGETRRGCSVSPPSCAATASCARRGCSRNAPGSRRGQVAARRRGATTRATRPVASRPTRSSPASSPTRNSSRAERRQAVPLSRTGSVPDDVGDEDSSGNSRRCSSRGRGPVDSRLATR